MRMTYEKLSKIYYKSEAIYKQEYEKRFRGYGTYQTGLKIRPVQKGQHVGEPVELFIVQTHKLMQLHEEILLNSFNIRSMVQQMPTVAIQPYFDKLLINELQSTNEIEGVRSTKMELTQVLQSVKEKNLPKDKRFIGLMKTYQYLDDIKPFEDITDFRKLYDEVVAEEVDAASQPDGELFRKESVSITDGHKATHIGVFPEEQIKWHLQELIEFLEHSRSPDLYKFMLAHYYYEYIHPFYDGNGRTGRLLVCSYVARKLDKFTAITLSYTINQDKQKYYKALEELSQPLNKGEGTFYMESLLELLRDGQKYVIEDLELGLAKLQKINKHLHQLDWADHDQKRLLSTLLEVSVFAGTYHHLSNSELIEATSLSRYKVNTYLSTFESMGIATKIRQRPVTYQLNDNYIEEILNASLHA